MHWWQQNFRGQIWELGFVMTIFQMMSPVRYISVCILNCVLVKRNSARYPGREEHMISEQLIIMVMAN